MKLFFQSIIVLLLLCTCDLSQPGENDLLDLNRPIIVHSVLNSSPTIEQLPQRIDFTNQIEWKYLQQEFEIKLESTIQNQHFVDGIGDVYVGTHRVYELSLESNNFIELTNFDSVTSTLEVTVENRWPFPDEFGNYRENVFYNDFPLLAQIVEMQIKTLDDVNFITVNKTADLLNIDLPFKLRIFLRISSGINLRTQTLYVIDNLPVTLNDFIPNSATYRIKFFLNGLYL